MPAARISRIVSTSSSRSSPRPTITPLLVSSPAALDRFSSSSERGKLAPGAGLAVEAGHRLDVVVEDVGARVEDDRERLPAALEVGDEHLDRAAGDAGADLANRGREDPGAAVRLVVAVHGRDHGVPQAHARGRVRDAARLVRVGGAPGRPVFTAQKPQARVHTSPRIMNVAVPRLQHSPRLGQWASSQTVWRSSPRIRPRSRS